MLSTLWNLILIEPIQTSLLWLGDLTGNFGIAIIILTILLQILLLPLRIPSLKSAKLMREIQPKVNELKEKYKDDKMKLAQAQMDLYKEHGVNMFGGILPTLLSLPIVFALYQVLLVTIPTVDASAMRLFWLDISVADPYYFLPVLVGISQYFMSKQMQMPTTPAKSQTDTKGNKKDNSSKKGQSSDDFAQAMQVQMKYVFPILSGVITASLPSGVGLYWLTSVVFAIIQQKVVELKMDK